MTRTMDAGNETDGAILDAIDRFLRVEVRPHVKRLEQADEYPTAIVEGMKAMGLFGCIIPVEYGGLGLSTATYAAVVGVLLISVQKVTVRASLESEDWRGVCSSSTRKCLSCLEFLLVSRSAAEGLFAWSISAASTRFRCSL